MVLALDGSGGFGGNGGGGNGGGGRDNFGLLQDRFVVQVSPAKKSRLEGQLGYSRDREKSLSTTSLKQALSTRRQVFVLLGLWTWYKGEFEQLMCCREIGLY